MTEAMTFDDHGWFSDENQQELQRIIDRHNVRVVIELGSWLGKSTRWFADRVSLVVTVDHWRGSPEHHQPHRTDVAAKLPRLYDQFRFNCRGYRNIWPICMETREAAELPLPTADLVYVDAAHDYESVWHDIYDYLPHLVPGGVMCGDDFDTADVAAAVRNVAEQLFYRVHVNGPFWRLEFDPTLLPDAGRIEARAFSV